MLLWIKANFATILICVVLAAVLTAAVRKLVQNKKKGRSECAGGCTGCPMSEKCSSKKN